MVKPFQTSPQPSEILEQGHISIAVGELQDKSIENPETAGLATETPATLANEMDAYPGAAAIRRDRALLATGKVKDSELTLLSWANS